MSVTRFDPFGDSFRHSPPTRLALDLWQATDGYHVAMDAPGIDPDSVKITVDHDILTIEVERQPEFHHGENVIAAERPEGNLVRQLQLGDNLDVDHIQETYSCDEGMLHLTIPLAQA